MEIQHDRCAGLDVHKDSVVACVRIADPSGVRREVRTFGTTTGALYDLSEWLASEGCTHVVMESTGVYWKPVWHVLEEAFELVLANAAHVRNLPGRKTDVNDATWLADLLAHGLVRSSFVPPEPIAQLRDLSRLRKQFVRERTQHVQRLQKVLEDANVKLASVISDITGKSGLAIVGAIADGERDPEALLKFAGPRLKASRASLHAALRGRVTTHHRFLLRLLLDQIAETDKTVARVDEEVDAQLAPFREHVERLMTIPGVSRVVALAIIAEIGADMSRFRTVGHLLSWAGMVPRCDESAGKRRSTRIRDGAPWLKHVLVQAAWAAVRVKGSHERALFVRLKGRRGPKKAIVAVAASLLQSAYFILRRAEPYRRDISPDEHAKRHAANTHRLVRKLKSMGYDVALTPVAA